MEMWPYETLYKEMVIFILLTLALQLCCNFSPIHVKQLFGTTSICVESLELLIDKLDGELKSFVAIIEIASRWKIINEEKWLERFGAEVKQLHERGHHLPRKALLDITEI
ncbi:unnamed protein product [Rhizophagus irregularis]|nr:unnamed protein product [Rhizophagus irregularis]